MTSTSSISSELSPVSVFREDFISARSFRHADRDAVIGGNFELAFFAVSWDRRCLSLARATEWKARHAVLIIPPITDPDGLCAAHEAELRKLLPQRCESLEILDGRTLGFDGVWDSLYAVGLKESKRALAPGAFLVDLSAMSRYYSTGLVAMIVRLGLAYRTECFYAEGKYDAKQDVREVLFSGGGWERKTVPFLDGQGNPSLGWYYLVAAGFDGTWIKKILLQEEPDRVGLLVPIPGVLPKYEDQCLKAIDPIVQEFIIPPEFQTRAAAADAVEAWRNLTAVSHERWEDERVAYLCCGTKPHALALTLRALVHRHAMVLYFLPEKYTVIPVEEAGVFWRYSIIDHSSRGT